MFISKKKFFSREKQPMARAFKNNPAVKTDLDPVDLARMLPKKEAKIAPKIIKIKRLPYSYSEKRRPDSAVRKLAAPGTIEKVIP